MTPTQIYSVMRQAGFQDDVEVSPGVSVAECMTAIALRESAGDPTAFNGNADTGDRSYGLLQINLRDPDVGRAITASGLITNPDGSINEDLLFDPLMNAKAGFLLYGNRLNNINVAWYINHGGEYTARYQANLPAAKEAAEQAS